MISGIKCERRLTFSFQLNFVFRDFFSFTISMMKLRAFLPSSVERGMAFRLTTRFSDSDVKPRFLLKPWQRIVEFDVWSNDAGNVEHTFSFSVAIPTWRCCNANRPKSSANITKHTWHAQSFDILMKLWQCKMCGLYKKRGR